MSHFLQFLDKKHGNRFARLQDYGNAQDALRISLSATDQCLARIRRERDALSGNGAVLSLQIQEQEMLVISKQSLHVMSLVYRKMNQFEDAYRCLDRIEVYINDQKKHDHLLYNQTMAQLSSMERNSKPHQSSSALALEGK